MLKRGASKVYKCLFYTVHMEVKRMFEDIPLEIFLVLYGVIVAALLVLVALSFYVVKQWQKAVILRFGKITQITEAGLHFKIPLIESVILVDLRTQTLEMERQVAITKDNISIGIDAVVFMKIEDAQKFVLNIEDYRSAVTKYAQASMRDLVGKYSLDDLLTSRAEIAQVLKAKVDELGKVWGIDVTNVEIQDISLPEDMKRAFAIRAEAERESEAIITKAHAELEASKNYKEAALNLKDPSALQLRILETIKQVSKDQSNTIIFALPTETLTSMGITGIAAASSINSSDARKRKKEALEAMKKPIALAPKEEIKESEEEEE